MNIIDRCKKCKHYYRTMASESGYNPAAYCHRFEDEGKSPEILTGNCFMKRQKRNEADQSATRGERKQTMTKNDLFNLANKGRVEIGGVSCVVDLRPDRDGELFIDIIVDGLSPLHDTAHLGGKWWEYVTDEECDKLPGELQKLKQDADRFFEDASREVKAHFSADGQVVIDDMPDSVKADWAELEQDYSGITQRFIRNAHPVRYINEAKKEWFALGRFTLDIGGKKYTPRWSYWLDRAYYRES